jgi:ABC-type Fe3+ transport system substrate-binding protein
VGFSAVLAACVVSACGNAGGAAGDAQSAYDNFVKTNLPGVSVDLVKAAQQEGAVTFYAVTDSANNAVVKAFQAKFPFIKVQLVQQPGGPLGERFETEQQAGRHDVDVVQASSQDTGFQFAAKGYVENYTPTSADKFPAEDTKPGLVYPFGAAIIGIGWRDGELPKDKADQFATWDGLTKVGGVHYAVLDAAAGGSTVLLNCMLQQRFGTKAWQNVATSGYNIYGGVQPATDSLLAGETDVIAGGSVNGMYGALAKGAPIAWAYPTPTLLLPTVQMIAKQPPHPNAAKLLQEFVLSNYAQTIYSDYSEASLRKDYKATHDANNKPAKDVSSLPWYRAPDLTNTAHLTTAELASCKAPMLAAWGGFFKK